MEKFFIDRLVLVSGLHWQILSDNPSESSAEIKQLARQLSYDLAVVRRTGIPQVGLAASADGYVVGMASAAAIVSKSVEILHNHRDFICATLLEDGRFLYVCQSEGVIVPDGDQIGTSEAIRLRLLEHLSLGKTWELIVAPLAWGIEGSIEQSFADLLPRKNGKLSLSHRWWQLKPVELTAFSLLKKFAIPLVVAGLLIAGGIGYQKWQSIKLAEEALRIKVEQQAAVAIVPPAHPWRDRPRAGHFVSACMKSIGGVKTLWPGNWELTSATCDAASKHMTIAWKRGEHGWSRHLLEIEPQALISADGESATLSRPIVFELEAEEALVEERIRFAQISDAVQGLGIQFSLTRPPPLPSLPGISNLLPKGQWNEWGWTMKSGQIAPAGVILAFDGPGFRVGRIAAVFNGGQISWHMEGYQYVL